MIQANKIYILYRIYLVLPKKLTLITNDKWFDFF